MTSAKNKINFWLAAAGILSVATAGLHVFGGTPEIMDPLHGSDAPLLSKGITQVMWDQITVLLLLGGATYIFAAMRASRAKDIAGAITVLYLGITALFLYSGVTMFQNVSAMPQWVLFLAMAALAIIGTMRSAQKI
jgi:hypothetical protein